MMKTGIIIIGAGGHGKVVRDIAELVGYTDISFLDDASVADNVVGKVADFERFIPGNDFFVAIGNGAVREKITRNLLAKNANVVSLIHPNATLSKSTKIGRGVVVMAGAVINADSTIADGVIINTCASVDHDCKIGEYVHIAVGAHLCGTVCVGNSTFIGAGAVISNDLSIINDCVIGSGAIVVRDIKEKGTYLGVPAKINRTTC